MGQLTTLAVNELLDHIFENGAYTPTATVEVSLWVGDPTISGEGLAMEWRTGSDGTVLRGPSDVSALIFYDTDAKGYSDTALVGLIDSGSIGRALDVLAPGAGGGDPPIPEPGGLGLIGLEAPEEM